MKKIFILSFLILSSCSKKEDLELEIINKNINCLDIKKDDIKSLRDHDKKECINKNAKTIVVYRLRNNSNKTYYFNLNRNNNKFQKNLFKLDRAYVKFTDEDNNEIKIRNTYVSYDSSFNLITKEVHDYIVSKELNYNYIQENHNFTIRPNEIIYFEYFIVLPYGNYMEDNANWIEVDSNKKYFSEILLNSDSTNYKKYISRTDLQTIKENGYEVYHGTLKSKNKIPIKFVNLKEK